MGGIADVQPYGPDYSKRSPCFSKSSSNSTPFRFETISIICAKMHQRLKHIGGFASKYERLSEPDIILSDIKKPAAKGGGGVREHNDNARKSYDEVDIRQEIVKTPQDNLSADQLRAKLNRKIANPLAGYSHAELAEMGEKYVRRHEIGGEDDIRAFRLGAILAQDPNRHAEVEGLTDQERRVLAVEVEHRWSQPKLLYLVIILCSTCAAVQGMGKLLR